MSSVVARVTLDGVLHRVVGSSTWLRAVPEPGCPPLRDDASQGPTAAALLDPQRRGLTRLGTAAVADLTPAPPEAVPCLPCGGSGTSWFLPCRHCDGDGESECDMGHLHRCEVCRGDGGTDVPHEEPGARRQACT